MSKVTLSKTTLDVLKNFATINSSIVFRQGSTVRTISNAENILAKYTGEEIFPTDFAIYDFCLLYTSPSPRDATLSRMPSSA